MVRSRNVRLVLALLLPTFCPAPVATWATEGARIDVIDADTVEQDGTRWRLVGLDAPEIHRAHCLDERSRGILAAARLITLLASEGGHLEAAGKGRDWAEIAIAEGHAV